jgi:hypothetical protein
MGGTLYTFALLGVVFLIVRDRSARRDAVANGAAAAVIATLAMAFFGNVFNGVSGVLFWSAVGFAVAGQSYARAVEQARRLTVQTGAPLDPTYARYSAAGPARSPRGARGPSRLRSAASAPRRAALRSISTSCGGTAISGSRSPCAT